MDGPAGSFHPTVKTASDSAAVYGNFLSWIRYYNREHAG